MSVKMAPIRLLDLPDEALAHIILQMSDMPHIPDMRRRSIVFAPPAWPLAMTCSRMMALFKQHVLPSIDGVYPEKYEVIPSMAIDGQMNEKHLATVARLADNQLKTLRLPRDVIGLNVVLQTVARKASALKELAFSNDLEPVSEDVERILFQNATELRKLTIFNPRGLLNHLGQVPNLRELELTGIRASSISQLIAVLKKVGSGLGVLKVGFDADGMTTMGENCIFAMTPIWCMGSFATYVAFRLAEDLPMLHTLEVNGSRCSDLVHESMAERTNMTHISLASAIETLIHNMRERNSSTKETRLKRLSLRCAFDQAHPTVFMCLDAFSRLVRPSVEVEIQFIGATVVYPADHKRPYFKAMQITYADVKQLPDMAPFDCSRIETFDVGTAMLADAYSKDVDIRTRMSNLVYESTDVLKNLNAEVEIDCPRTLNVLCSYMADIMEISPNVESVSVRTGIIDYADKGMCAFRRLMGFMTNIKVLRLTIHPIHSADCKMAFAGNLPMFLNEVAHSCPNLECLFLELAMPVQASSIAADEIRKLCMESHRMCLRAVKYLEDMVPGCDVSSVRAQLEVWHRALNPTKLLHLVPNFTGIYNDGTMQPVDDEMTAFN